jgi:AcrR family transcriptional regulator
MTKRRYVLRERAQRQDETRARIVEAAVALHGTIGPRATTVSAIAERAGVQRLTVYRHFPDEHSLFAACSAHWSATNPPPDPAIWAELREPAARARAALLEPMSHVQAYVDGVAAGLLDAWPKRARSDALAATVAHCVRFATWQSLNGTGLDDRALADLCVRWLEAAAGPTR